MQTVLGELNEYAREATMHIERAKILKDKAKSTAQLVRINLYYQYVEHWLTPLSYPICSATRKMLP